MKNPTNQEKQDAAAIVSHVAWMKEMSKQHRKETRAANKAKAQAAIAQAEQKKKDDAPFVAQKAFLDTLIWHKDWLARACAKSKKKRKDEEGEGECHE
jgi:predicted nucleic acid-binding protein